MTAVADPVAVAGRRSLGRRSGVALPPLSPALELARALLVTVCLLAGGVVLQLAVLSGVQQRATQQQAFDHFRGDLANGVAPTGPTDAKGHALAVGTSMAYLEIPSIHLRQVVVEGTSSGALFKGPGHRRDSVFPGQSGTSIIVGRRAAYGAPFGRLRGLEPGAAIRVTTGAGVFEYRVTAVRHDGDPGPAALKAGASRLLLMTAGGQRFVPSGLVRVDADSRTPAIGGRAPLFAPRTLPAAEQVMHADWSTLWALALWLQALIVVVFAAVWAWKRRPHAWTWVVFVPPLVLLFLSTSREAAHLLPNVL